MYNPWEGCDILSKTKVRDEMDQSAQAKLNLGC